ncbi:MAG: hypothetical protein J1F68_03780 [Clostridiales bacterium]|nr:hypothetical protein [Clostridiales bacterium]
MFKKIILILAILLSLVITCNKIAYAEIAYADTEDWARVLIDGIMLYANEDQKQELFQLEKSYYVNIIGETDNMYQVAVMPENMSDFVQAIGWVRKNDVSKCSAPIAPCYPTVKLTVNGDSVDLKQLPLPSAAVSCAIFNSQDMCYYGKIESYGKTWYCVRYAARFGYVEAGLVSEPKIELHPTPLPQAPANTVPTTPSVDPTPDLPLESNSPASEILLIVFVVVLAVGLTLALFLPGNFKKKTVFEQDI